MLEALRRAIVSVAAQAQRAESASLARRALGMAASALRRPGGLDEGLAGITSAWDMHASETGTWVAPDVIAAGRGGPFDACDLRAWLALASRADVASVPAVEILRLTEEEMSAASGSVEFADGPLLRGVRRMAAALPDRADEASPAAEPVDMEALSERLAAAMDGVPEGWMVRSARCGSIELKAMAGAGAAGPEAPEARFGPDLEVGPGWIRLGNRRRVNPSDNRTVEMHAQGPGGDCAFLARPWVPAARWWRGEDPHRHGTPFAGKGIWPAEWRAFVEGGRVVGVSAYYGWCGSASPENARMAVAVRALAQRVADEAATQRAWPRYMDVEFVRARTDDPKARAISERFGREDVACTLDFIEGPDGLLLLEGGPAFTPVGGGHPCAFAGSGGVAGVALRTMPGVMIGDPSTWKGDHERDGCVLTWDEAEALAA